MELQTKKYKNLLSFMKANDIKAYTLDDYITNYIWLKKFKKYCRVVFDEDPCYLLAEAIGNPSIWATRIRHLTKSCGIFSRVTVEMVKRNGKTTLRPSYTAGQDSISEKRYIQGLIRKWC